MRTAGVGEKVPRHITFDEKFAALRFKSRGLCSLIASGCDWVTWPNHLV